MKVKVYASIVCEVEICEKEYRNIATSHTNAIPDRIFDQIEDALQGNAELLGIDRIDDMNGDCVQEY
jgi:hypothetical protein